MEEQFDFKKVGKRMPYRVPEGFFADLEKKVMDEVAEKKRPARFSTQRILRIVTGSVMGLAASVAIVCAIYSNLETEEPANDFLAVEQAFSALSAEDQAYILESYQMDTFIDESEDLYADDASYYDDVISGDDGIADSITE